MTDQVWCYLGTSSGGEAVEMAALEFPVGWIDNRDYFLVDSIEVNCERPCNLILSVKPLVEEIDHAAVLGIFSTYGRPSNFELSNAVVFTAGYVYLAHDNSGAIRINFTGRKFSDASSPYMGLSTFGIAINEMPVSYVY